MVFAANAGAQSKTSVEARNRTRNRGRRGAHSLHGGTDGKRGAVSRSRATGGCRAAERRCWRGLKEIAGSFLVDPNGTVVKDSSKIIVRLTSLKSDKDRRDGYVQRRTLETAKFPTVELVPTTFQGLGAKPGAAPTAFDLLADLTVHGVTRPTAWKVTAHTDGSDIVGLGDDRLHVQRFLIGSAERPGRAERERHDQARVRLPLHANREAVDCERLRSDRSNEALRAGAPLFVSSRQ